MTTTRLFSSMIVLLVLANITAAHEIVPERNVPRRVIGSTAEITAPDAGIRYLARVDTGARASSIHSDSWTIAGESDTIEENVGKVIRFRTSNRQGDHVWVERRIAEVREIRTSEGTELRYMVLMTLQYGGVTKQVKVSLNNRAHMSYAMLLGRDFLANDFLVDVTGDP